MTEPRIDAYIAKAQPFAQPILEHLRQFVHAAVPGVEEAIKWNVPHFTYRGKNLAGMSAFKAHCAFAVHNDRALGQYMKMATVEEIPEQAIAAELKAARAAIDEKLDAPKLPKQR